MSLAFYPKYFGFLAWFALVRPILILTTLSGREAFNAAYFFGFFFNLFCLYWVGLVSPPGMVTAVLILAFYYAIILGLFVRVYRINNLYGFVLFPFLWVGVEYFRTLSEFAFPWNEIGYTQSYYLYISQIVSIVSVQGISFLIAFVNVLLCQIFRKNISAEKKLTSGLVSAAIIILLVAYGWIVTPPYPVEGKTRVGLLQGAVPIDVKWDQYNREYSINRYDSLTQSIADSAVELYVWPETSAPCYLSYDKWCENRVADIARKSNAYHLVGALGVDYGPGDQYMAYNSVYQFNPEGILGSRYDKVKLVPFAERVPYQDQLPFLKGDALKEILTFIETYDINWWSDFYGGDSMVLYQFNDKYYAPIICFESTFPDYVRQNILNGAEFLVGITNDTWFGTSVGIHMHSRIFLMRCIENGSWGVRVANSGITYIVDGYGRIRRQLPIGDVAVMFGRVGEYNGRSTFTEYGNVTGKLCWLITVSIAGIFLITWLLQRLFLRRAARS